MNDTNQTTNNTINPVQDETDATDQFQIEKQENVLSDSSLENNSNTDEQGGRLVGSVGDQSGSLGQTGIGSTNDTTQGGISFADEEGWKQGTERETIEEEMPGVNNPDYQPTNPGGDTNDTKE